MSVDTTAVADWRRMDMEGSKHHGSQRCCAQGHERSAHEEGCGQANEHAAGDGCCGGHAEDGGRLRRRFRSRDERLAQLEQYRRDLQEELKGVAERIGELRSGT